MDVNWGRSHVVLFVGRLKQVLKTCSQPSVFSYFYFNVVRAVELPESLDARVKRESWQRRGNAVFISRFPPSPVLCNVLVLRARCRIVPFLFRVLWKIEKLWTVFNYWPMNSHLKTQIQINFKKYLPIDHCVPSNRFCFSKQVNLGCLGEANEVKWGSPWLKTYVFFAIIIN